MKSKLIQPPSYFSCGDRKLNIIHTRLRNMCSSLNSDLHRVNIKPSPACSCGHPVEDSIHYFLQCALHNEAREILFSKLESYAISIELLLAGDGDLSFQQNKDILSPYNLISE